MTRKIPGDSEWFDFKGSNPYELVKSFIESRLWVIRRVQLSDIQKPSRYLNKPYHKNLSFLKTKELRNSELDLIQKPAISSISSFIIDSSRLAGYVIAPCGSGKTLMTAKSMRGLKRCIICCPSRQIQFQWKKTLFLEETFELSDIYMIGQSGTTDIEDINIIAQKEVFCIISTYMSCHLLLDSLAPNIELIVFDEAHHMAGIVSEDTGEGRTRRLLESASKMNIKRLFLTYTPRVIVDNYESGCLSMNDTDIFGEKIIEINIRDLINKGVLPEYRIWSLRDEAKQGKGVIAKAECLLEAWNSKEIVRGAERYILHHLIVFTQTKQEAKELEQFFLSRTTNTVVIRVEQGDRLEDPIKRFTLAERAIIVNCFVLTEGVDIPIANSVAITYPKQSRGQITQMVLRAGRWFENKELFHILIPTLGDEDLSGFQEVLLSLAVGDTHIRDEIFSNSSSESKESSSGDEKCHIDSVKPQCIVIDKFNSNPEEIRKCFSSLMRGIYNQDNHSLQDFCLSKGISTSVEYQLLRISITDLPEDPRSKNQLWYDYFHPNKRHSISKRDFISKVLEPNQLYLAHLYEEWRINQPIDMKESLPSIQHITDGVFGKDNTNFNLLKDQKVKRR
jgi:superfamily II DNA or RNA helicase